MFSTFKTIGQGSFGSVYSAMMDSVSSFVAIKQIDKLILEDDSNRKHFLEELSILKKVDHPFIAHYYGHYESCKSVFIIMELGTKGNLLQMINTHGMIPINQARMIFSQLASALYYLHKCVGVVHRDIKLENVIFDENENARLVDFGLSSNVESVNSHMKTKCGSYPYAAPELILGKPYTSAIDVWSLGVCLYASVIGALPYYHSNTNNLLKMILETEPQYPEYIPPDLVHLLKNMLQKSPEDRISIQEVCAHPFFKLTPIKVYLKEGIFNVSANRSSFIDNDITNLIKSKGIDVETITQEGSIAYSLYRILRKIKVLDAINRINDISPKNPILKRQSAPDIIRRNQFFCVIDPQSSSSGNDFDKNSQEGTKKHIPLSMLKKGPMQLLFKPYSCSKRRPKMLFAM